MVQLFTMLSVLELRTQLGWTQARFAKHVCSTIRSVIKWESGQGQPDAARRKLIHNLARCHRAWVKRHEESPTHNYDAGRMRYYEGKPGPAWRYWSGQKRGSFLGHRARYKRIRSDAQVGRVFAQPNVGLDRPRR